eukprot:3796338-Amphidinium_carterae.2
MSSEGQHNVWEYGALLHQDILVGYASGAPLVVVARVLLTCSMLVVLPVNSVPTIRSFNRHHPHLRQ